MTQDGMKDGYRKRRKMKPNTKFELTVKDIDIIEHALRSAEQTREIQEVLGKIHNQKNFYQRRGEIYVSG